MSFAKPLHLRLFLEGIEVPVVSAQVSVHLNAPALASIQIVPIDEGLHLKPRTMVHLFFLERPSITDPDTNEKIEYRLLFTGETVGFSTIQRANGRSLVLQCLDFSNYWDAALSTVINYGPQGNNFTHKSEYYGGTNATAFDNIVNFEQTKLSSWINQKPETPGLTNVSGLAGGVIRMLEAISGISGKSKGINDFFTIAQLRCKILEQICAEENDSTVGQLVKIKVFDEWIRQSFQSMGEQVSFRQMVELLMQYAYHDFVPNPTPKYDVAFEGTPDKKDAKLARLRTHILRPNCWMSPPPRSNVIFPEHYTDLTYERTFIQEPTRMLLVFRSALQSMATSSDVELLSQRFLAPSKAVKVDAGKGYRVLMKHELHTGIVPRIEWVPDTASPKGKDFIDDYNEAQRNWALKIQEFKFFHERFVNRNASVSGRFNPYLICGWPALVIRRPFILNAMQSGPNATNGATIDLVTDPSNEEVLNAPSQLLGMIQSISHNITQDGGTSSITLNYAREHSSVEDEFLGTAITDSKDAVKRINYVITSKTALNDAKLKKFLVGATPQAAKGTSSSTSTSSDTTTATHPQMTYDPTTGKLSQVQVTSTFMRTRQGITYESDTAPVKTGRIDGIDEDVLVPDGTVQITPGKKNGFYGGDIVGIEVLDPNRSIFNFATDGDHTSGDYGFDAIRIYENITLKSKAQKPVERILEPPWFSKNYLSDQIGTKVYKPFFGTGSIVDETEFQTAAGTVTSASDTVDPTSDDPTHLLERLQNLDASGTSIEKCVNLLGYLYGLTKAQDMDVEEFIHNYIWRPIASLSDMFGYNLDFEIDTSQPTKLTPIGANGTNSFKIGFHSTSVHPKAVNRETRMVGLVDDPTTQLTRLNGEGKAESIQNYDVRREKWDAVTAYVVALTKGPGFRG